MNSEDLITESVASRLAGVSPSTLNRFVEAGYLQVESNRGAEKLFSRSELLSIFGFDDTEISKESESAVLSDKIEVEKSSHNGQASKEAPSENLRSDQASAPERPPEAISNRTSASPKLQQIIKYQERLLEQKELQIADLRENNAWLKTRLERMEEKADRDQLLLLSETQVIRRLIAIQEPKKSTMRLALE
ncbi:MAG: hypothetical protein DCC75_13985, partial [Proteobacteria bacterium]